MRSVVIDEHRLHVDYFVTVRPRPLHEVPTHDIMVASIPPVFPALCVTVRPDAVNNENDLLWNQAGTLRQHPQESVYPPARCRHQLGVSDCRICLPEPAIRPGGGLRIVAATSVRDSDPLATDMIVAVSQ